MILTKQQVNNIVKCIKNINSNIAICVKDKYLIVNTINPNIPVQAGIKCVVNAESNSEQLVLDHDFILILNELIKHNEYINI